MSVIDVTEATFADEVIQRSHTTPVVVDFWAAWCGPCRSLGPILEAVAARREGKAVLAKLDTDANPAVAQAYDIRSIPAVKGFRGGAVVDEFIGVQPPAAVERFFDLLIPSEAAELAKAGDEQSLRRALELEPGLADAAVPLARILLARGELGEALDVLAQVVGSFQAEGLSARIRLQAEEDGSPEIDELLARAFSALDEGDTSRSLDLLVEALPGADDRREDIRRVIVGELDALGPAHPLARETRRRLAVALY